MNRTNTRMLSESALLVAAAQILSYLKLWQMPWGGSVTLTMVPIVWLAIRWGLAAGTLGGLALGTLQFLFDGGFAIGWQTIVGDYLLAYGALGAAALLRHRRGAVVLGTLLGGAARYLVHFTVGATVWAEYMPERFFGMTMHSPWFYSALYNFVYMLPNVVLTALVLLLLRKPLEKYLRPEK